MSHPKKTFKILKEFNSAHETNVTLADIQKVEQIYKYEKDKIYMEPLLDELFNAATYLTELEITNRLDDYNHRKDMSYKLEDLKGIQKLRYFEEDNTVRYLYFRNYANTQVIS